MLARSTIFKRAYQFKGRYFSTTRNFTAIVREPFQPITNKIPTHVSAQEAMSLLRSDFKVYLHSGIATPIHLVSAMSKHALENQLSNINLYHLRTSGKLPVGPEYKGIFKDNSFRITDNVREAISNGRAESIPIFLSEIPQLFYNDIKLDVALIQVSPVSKHGYYSLGTNVDVTRDAIKTADIVIGQVNKYMPRTFGDGQIHQSHFDYLVHHNEPLPGYEPSSNEISSEHRKIGLYVAQLVEDGSTLQIGIGPIETAFFNSLTNHKNIGVHSEMISDGMVDLIKAGIITNSQKIKHVGKTVGSLAQGSKKLLEFINDNPTVQLYCSEYVNNNSVIRENEKVCAINRALEIDLTGQVSTNRFGNMNETEDFELVEDVGGKMDFMRGAALSKGGKPIITLESTKVNGKGILKSRIVPTLNVNSGVSSTRAHVQHVVTEYGHVNLYGKTLRQRAKLLISIAHPDFREELERQAFKTFGNLDL